MVTGSLFTLAPIMRALANQAALVFVSSLVVQISTFAVVGLGALLLPIQEVARLNIIVASATMSALALELGLNVTMIKRFGESGSQQYLLAPLAIRLIVFPISAAVGFAVWFTGAEEIGLGLLLGGALNLWNGSRATNQAQQHYDVFARDSVLFGVSRLLIGLWALLVFKDAGLVALATYLLPVILIAAPGILRTARAAFQSLARPTLASTVYTTQIYINQLAFSALPYIPLYFVDARLPDGDVVRYGLALALLAPVTLAISSVRAAVLPKLVAKGSSLEEWLWSPRSVISLTGLGVLLLFVGVLASVAIEAVYHSRYPHLWLPFLTLFSATVTTGMLGIYGLSVHTRNAAHLLVIVNVLRLAVLLPLLFAYGHSLMAITQLTAAVMIAGELLLVFMVRRHLP